MAKDMWLVSTHSRAEAAASPSSIKRKILRVSTHSRAEAAAHIAYFNSAHSIRFNTQPRGGGCGYQKTWLKDFQCFNTQPRGGGCASFYLNDLQSISVSTHSRAEAAAPYLKKQEKSAN